jgi:hypothetical protein
MALSITTLNTEWHELNVINAECRYAECLYAECRGAQQSDTKHNNKEARHSA